jgi:hypothetical protein
MPTTTNNSCTDIATMKRRRSTRAKSEVSVANDQVGEEPDAVKAARPVLKTSSGSDPIAEFNILPLRETSRRYLRNTPRASI